MSEQSSPEQSDSEQSSPEQSGSGLTDAPATPAPAEPVARKRRPGKPKVDPVLSASVELAHEALHEIAAPEQVGDHLGVSAEEDRLLTHRFAADKPGYRGWEWFVTVARAPRAKKVTVCEIGLLPGDQALIAPPWVPWLERMNDEEKQAHQAEQADSERS